MKYSIKRTVLAVALVGAFGAANATPLVINVPSSNVDVTASFFGGTLLDSAVTAITNPSYNGTARTAVYDNGTGLDFYYQFTNNTTSQTGIQRLVGFDFTSLDNTVDVYQTSSAFGVFTAGTAMSSTADRGPFGVIGFNFSPTNEAKILPGFTSYTQIIRTNSRDYVAGNFGILNGTASNVAGFAPAIAMPVPEPESLAMLLAGLGLIGSIARRRNRGRSCTRTQADSASY